MSKVSRCTCGSSKKPSASVCYDADDSPMSLSAIARHYQAHSRTSARAELCYFASRQQFPTLADAVTAAARSDGEDEKRLSHQRRIKKKAIRAATAALLAISADINNCGEDFHALFGLIEETLSEVPGIGELFVYDVAHRIGAWLGCEPTKVYLHCGVRVGARALGFDTSAGVLEMSELPGELQNLSAAEVEDILCIYKHRFRKRSPGRRGRATRGNDD